MRLLKSVNRQVEISTKRSLRLRAILKTLESMLVQLIMTSIKILPTYTIKVCAHAEVVAIGRIYSNIR